MRNRMGASGARCKIEGARHGVAGARERRDEAVALTLFDGSHSTMCREQIGQDGIKACDGGRHLVRLGLPEPRGALDVGKQQRHRAGGKLAHDPA